MTINVSNILSRPAFIQSFKIVQKGISLGFQDGYSLGNAQEGVIDVQGSVQPVNLNIDRTNNLNLKNDSIICYFKNDVDINISSITYGTDYILYNSKKWIVQNIKDYNIHGHYELTAELEVLDS